MISFHSLSFVLSALCWSAARNDLICLSHDLDLPPDGAGRAVFSCRFKSRFPPIVKESWYEQEEGNESRHRGI